MKVIKEYEGGKKVNSIARDNQLSHSTVSTILKDKDRIKEAVKAAAPIKSTIITKKREGPIAEMEKLLYTWLEDNRQRNVKMMLRGVQSKATSLFKTIRPYKEIYEEKKKKTIQTDLSMFIKRTVNPSVETPQPASSSVDPTPSASPTSSRGASPPPVSPRDHTTSPPASPELPDLSLDRNYEESVDDVQPSTNEI